MKKARVGGVCLTHILDYYFQATKMLMYLVTKDHNESHYDI